MQLWGSGADARIDFAELAADIAVEAEQAQALTEQIEDLDERCANLYAEADPTGIITSAPGIGPVSCAVIAGRIGDPHRFHSLAAIRAYSGLIPKVNQSGQAEHHDGLTKAGDPLLRETLFGAADQARRTDPQLAAKYKRLMDTERRHDSAICHIATILLTRIATCWRPANTTFCATPTAATSPPTKDAASSAPTTQSTDRPASRPPTPANPSGAKAGRAGNPRSRQALQFSDPPTRA